jgi:tellurite methyltransferase
MGLTGGILALDPGRCAAHDARVDGPLAWLVENAAHLPPEGRALDVACGTGRNALWLSARGLSVRAVDNDPARLRTLEDSARRLGLTMHTRCLDLEKAGVDLGYRSYLAIVVARYLHRPLFPALLRALAPGGVLVYETFTVAQASRGRPTSPAFLLQPGELRRLVTPLVIMAEREGEFEGHCVASVVARAPLERLTTVPS